MPIYHRDRAASIGNACREGVGHLGNYIEVNGLLASREGGLDSPVYDLIAAPFWISKRIKSEKPDFRDFDGTCITFLPQSTHFFC